MDDIAPFPADLLSIDKVADQEERKDVLEQFGGVQAGGCRSGRRCFFSVTHDGESVNVIGFRGNAVKVLRKVNLF